MARDAIILGAGASAADGAPLQAQLFPAMLGQPTVARAEMADRGPRIAKALEDFFGATSDHGAYPTFEEALGVLELALQRQESFRGYSNLGGVSKIGQLREDLIFGIAVALDQTLQTLEPTNHWRLTKRLAEMGVLRDCTFLSLNYDILIDNALVDCHPQFDVDYGVTFANFGNGTDQWKRPRASRAIKLLKLHGSLNWLYCPACTALSVTPKVKGAVKLALETQRCSSCGATIVPIIIPPSYFKVISNVHLHEIWNQAERALRGADRLIFCGYSFPDADLHFKYMLKRAEVGRSKPWEVIVVNGQEEKTHDESSGEARRFRRFFRAKELIRVTDVSFQRFATSGIDGARGAAYAPGALR